MSEQQESGRKGGGAAGVVAGLLLIGILILGLAAGTFFVAHAQEEERLQEMQAKEHAARLEAEHEKEAAAARAKAEHERARKAEEALQAHEARQVEALHAEEEAHEAHAPSKGPPELRVGAQVELILAGGKKVRSKVLALRGKWVRFLVEGEEFWVNFDRVEAYRVLK